MFRRSALNLSRFIGSIFIFLFAWNAHAEPERRYLYEPINGTLAQSRSLTITDKISALREKAKADGEIAVIVTLKVLFAPEGELSAQTALQQKTEIEVAFKSVRNKLTVARIKNVESIREFPSIPVMAMRVTPAELELLLQQPEIISVDIDEQLKAFLTESAPIVGAPSAWSAGFTGSGVTVAILDTGVDKTHPFLSGKVVSEACYSGGSNSSASFCPSGATSSLASGSGTNCPLNYSGCDHGTHVAGIVAGNSGAMWGVAKNANIIAIQVFSKSGTGTTAFTSDIIAGLQRVYDLRNTYNIAAVNMSLGGGRYTSTCDTASASTTAIINNLRSVKIATIIASGNEEYTDSIAFPACISSAISVGATWDVAGYGLSCDTSASAIDKVACFSNSASILKLLAPGIIINSSIPNGSYGLKAGTSMAAPMVAGAWAVLTQASPGISVTDALNAFTVSGTPITDYRNGVTKPRINVVNAINNGRTYALTYTKAGTGAGSVAFSSGSNSTCSASCSNTYTSGTSVTLTATAASGSTFAGWSGTGGCTGTSNTCTLTMSAARAVTATFTVVSCIGIGCAIDSDLNVMSEFSDAPFFSQTTYKSGLSGASAAQSGQTSDSGYSCIYTTIRPPGSLSVISTPSSEDEYDWVNFYFNGQFVKGYSGGGLESGTWMEDNYEITGSRAAIIEFCYEKDDSVSDNLDAGFVDMVKYSRNSNARAKAGPLKITEVSSKTINQNGQLIRNVRKVITTKRAGESGTNLPPPRLRKTR